MYILLIILLLIFAIIEKKFKSKAIGYISIIFLVLFLMFNRGNPDYENYKIIFEQPYGYAESGYIFLINIIKALGGQSHNFILIILGLFLTFTLFRWKKLVNKLNIVVVLYAIFPFVLDVIQIRNTFMILFVLNAIIELLKGNKAKCMFLLFLGSQFHVFGYLFMLAFGIIILIKDKKTFYHLLIIGNIFLFIILPMILELFLPLFPKIANYVTTSNKEQSLLIWGLILALDLIIFNFFIIKQTTDLTINKRKELHILHDIIYTGVIFYPGLIYINEFSRFFRSMFIIKYLFIAMALPHVNKKSRVILLLYIFSTAILLAALYSRTLDFSNILMQNSLFD